jgi:signal transduction histidine kinase
MPDTLPYPAELIGGDRIVADDTVAGSTGTLTSTRISQTPGSEQKRAALPIAWRLAILVMLAILPVLSFAAFMIANYSQAQRAAYTQQLQATSRAASLAIDAEIARQAGILKGLLGSSAFRNGDWRAFHELAKAAIVDEPDERVSLFDPSGIFVMSTPVPFGTDLGRAGGLDAIRTVVDTRQPFVSNLFVGAVNKTHTVSVYVPAIENGSVTHVLSIAVAPARILRILRSSISSEGGAGVVIDRQGIVIARTLGDDKFVGHAAVPALVTMARESAEGTFDTLTLEDLLVRGVFHKSPVTGWTVALVMEARVIDADLWRSLWLFGGGGAILVVIALLFALFYARAIARPLVALSGMAAALGRGEHIPARHLNLREAQDTADQMRRAGAALEQRAREVERLNATVNQRARALEVANKDLESFAYSVSHDLRVPLRAIDGFSQILVDGYKDKLDAEGRRVLQVVRDGAIRMGRLIDDILAFSRIGRQAIAASETDTAALVDDALHELAPFMADRCIEMKVEPLPHAHGDPVMLQRVWINLLANAIKFTRLKPHAVIEVGARAEGGETVFFVKDNGAGFNMKYVDKLFGVFQRLHRMEDFPGTGIGLAIVHRIVTQHGGRVWAEGKVGEGATFRFTLPHAVADHA